MRNDSANDDVKSEDFGTADHDPADLAATLRDMVEAAVVDPRQNFGSFLLSRVLGMRVSYEGERCIVAFEARKPLFNPQGALHGGIIATALDMAMGHLLQHTDGAGVTLELKVQYLAAIVSGMVRCEATFLRRGRSVAFLQATAFNSDGEIAAHATSTWKLLKPAQRSA